MKNDSKNSKKELPAKKEILVKKGHVPQIVSEGQHPALRQVADEISLSEIKSAKIQQVIEDMKLALDSQEDGIGLAAPQIGIPLRIFIVSKKIFSTHKTNGEDIKVSQKSSETDTTDGTTKNSSKTESVKSAIPTVASSQTVIDDLVFINPVLTKESKEKKWMEGEGCLSVRWVYGKVRRSTKVTIRAYDQFGRAFERGAGGLLAHIFQHEVDHLNGILFIDKAKDLEEVDPKEQNRSKKSSAISAKKK
ncbi:MAG: peptide deformylase [Candidatus Pacebacteria bacterium]|nr:peptide deformylase [Candidatus Paceibacterota bacterium]